MADRVVQARPTDDVLVRTRTSWSQQHVTTDYLLRPEVLGLTTGTLG